MDLQKLKSLLKQGEGPKLDYKEKIDISLESGKKELVKDVIAIANSQGGRGHLVIGVRDKTKEIIGIDPSSINEERIQQIISNRCDPPINIRVEYIDVDSKTVGVITIFRSQRKPHQMRQTGAFYIRRGSTTDFARRDEIASMLQNGGIINNEQIPIYNIGSDALNDDLIKKYLKRTNIGDFEGDNILLNNLGIIHYDKDSEQFYATIGGLLVFGYNPQMYLPHTGINLIYFEGKKKISKYFSGNLLSLLDNLTIFIKEYLKETKYPLEPIEEAIANAIAHRDYFDTSREILVYIGDDKIEISNPGSISTRDTITNISKEKNPFRRNNWLYHVLLVMDDKKRFMKSGLGIQKIKDAFNKTGKVRFSNFRKNNLFKIVLPGKNSIGE
ncbi:RNA-binding domain-containing protein [Wukongibacter sp. M2B1]|uniref:RNA-binding domain-containing protein n=1 Tax=Wukongibacter sp. M2B1 TaxID=3088895 RepID=UPI003D7A113C